MPSYETALFIFRRDLRLHDNGALNAALCLAQRVVPCFFFDPRQLQSHPYRSDPGLRFMLQAIADLQQQLQEADGKLVLYHGEAEALVAQLIHQLRIDAVFFNRDYTPFSRRRDAAIAEQCERLGVALHILPDALLIEPEQALKSDGLPYKVFTAFYNRARQVPVAAPQALAQGSFLVADGGLNVSRLSRFIWPVDSACSEPVEGRILTGATESELRNLCVKLSMGCKAPQETMCGGRQQALAILERLSACRDYENQRDYPFADATSRLSAHLKFGTCSIRETYYAIVEQLGEEHSLLRQLYWRDFFTHIAYHFPRVFGRAFMEKYHNVQWDNHPEYFQAWCAGRTGFPLVDAGMRELNASGFMHNRVRMITASFLVKDLHIDWRWGERYFAQHLVDYDPCVNNGNWQWAASTGCDAQPYFRIFNPWNQQQKFDPDCRYIRRWIPELRELPTEIIRQWDKKHTACGYPAPIIDHGRESRTAKERYRTAAGQGD